MVGCGVPAASVIVVCPCGGSVGISAGEWAGDVGDPLYGDVTLC